MGFVLCRKLEKSRGFGHGPSLGGFTGVDKGRPERSFSGKIGRIGSMIQRAQVSGAFFRNGAVKSLSFGAYWDFIGCHQHKDSM